MMVCVGCGQSIDLAFDSVLRDEAERLWHATCRTKRLGRQDVNVNPNAELAAATFSPTLWVGPS